MRQPKQRIPAQGLDLKDQVISINRVTKVVKGGKNLSFAALVVVGDEGGHVGFGTGKAREVPLAIKKGVEAAKKNLIRVPLINNTLPHQLIGEYGAGRVLVKPASEGTGVIAGGAVRAVMQAVGVRDVRTKVLGSTNPQRHSSSFGQAMRCTGSRRPGYRPQLRSPSCSHCSRLVAATSALRLFRTCWGRLDATARASSPRSIGLHARCPLRQVHARFTRLCWMAGSNRQPHTSRTWPRSSTFPAPARG